VVIALAVELACAGELKPCLEVLGDGLVEQGPLGVARAWCSALMGVACGMKL